MSQTDFSNTSPLHDSQRGYLFDASLLEFETRVLKVRQGKGALKEVTLERTYFYPTGGGQDCDTGWLGEARVLEVLKPPEGTHLLHIVEGEVQPGMVWARIDADRRQRHMQNHTAQHLLSQCFLRLFDLETLSARLRGYAPSTIDLPAVALGEEELRAAEEFANRLVFRNLPVRSYFVSPEDLEKIPLRNPPKVNELIRIVEIEGYDYAPCGGTHCRATGEIGLLKVLKVESMKARTRVHFTAGWTALEEFHRAYQAASRASSLLSVGMESLVEAIQRQSEQLHQLREQLFEFQEERLQREAERLIQQAEAVGALRWVHASYHGRSSSVLRQLAQHLQQEPHTVALLGSEDQGKASLVLFCGTNSGANASQLLHSLLEPWDGAGGGDARLAQGGFQLTTDEWERVFAQLAAQLRESLSSL